MQQEYPDFSSLFNRVPQARAKLNGNILYPEIKGEVWFYQALDGVLVVADIEGLPTSTLRCNNSVLGFHIHEGGSCSGNASDPFFNVGQHYNSLNCPHPQHNGDLPPLFVVNGFAFMAVLTDRFIIDEIIGKTVVIHSMPDNFTSQPSGNSGTKMACGEIKRYN